MYRFQKHITTSAYQLATATTSTSSSGKSKQIPQQFSNKITKSFLDSLYSLLDGLVHLASEESPVEQGIMVQKTLEEKTGMTPIWDLRNNVCYLH